MKLLNNFKLARFLLVGQIKNVGKMSDENFKIISNGCKKMSDTKKLSDKMSDEKKLIILKVFDGVSDKRA